MTKDSIGNVERSRLFQTASEDKSPAGMLRVGLYRQRKRFQLLLDSIPFAIVLVNADNVHTYVNKKFTEMFGYTLKEVPDRETWFEKVYPDKSYRSYVRSKWSKCHGSKEPGTRQVYMITAICKDGSAKTVQMYAIQFTPAESMVIYEDFSDLISAKEALQKSENRIHSLYEKAVDPILIFDGNVFVDCNEAAVRIMRASGKEQLLRRTPFEISPEVQPDGSLSALEGKVLLSRCIKHGSSHFEWLHRNVKQEELLVEVALTRISVRGEKLLFVVFWRDITQRKKGQRELKESEERYRNMFESNPRPTIVFDIETLSIIDVNEAAVGHYGYERNRFVGMTMREIVEKDDLKIFELEASNPDLARIRCSSRHRKEDGSIIYVEVAAHVVQFSGKRYRMAFINDVTEARQSAEALRFTQFAVDNAAVGMIWIREDGSILYANDETHRFLGYTRAELQSMMIHEIDPGYVKEMWGEAWSNLKKLGSITYETLYRSNDGVILPVELTGNYMEYERQGYLCAIVRDITERKKTEESLQKREDELRIESNRLEEANTALKVLLKHREEDKRELEERFLSNVKELVLPYVDKLKKSRLDRQQTAFLDIIETNMNDIISPFLQRMSLKYSNFTQTEVQVANLIKIGKNTKEIAELMNVSTGTIDTHRNSIRDKLGLKRKKINLRVYLLSVSGMSNI